MLSVNAVSRAEAAEIIRPGDQVMLMLVDSRSRQAATALLMQILLSVMHCPCNLHLHLQFRLWLQIDSRCSQCNWCRT